MVLCASPLADEALKAVQASLALPLVQRIVREGEIADGLRLLRGVPEQTVHEEHEASGSRSQTAGVPLLGDLLIERGAVRRADFDAALARYKPQEHGRIGDYMVAQGILTREALADAIEEQRRLRDKAASI